MHQFPRIASRPLPAPISRRVLLLGRASLFALGLLALPALPGAASASDRTGELLPEVNGPSHDLADNGAADANDAVGHDANDDNGVDPAGHDANDDNGADPAGHDANDDNGGASGNSGPGNASGTSGPSGNSGRGSSDSNSGKGSSDSGRDGGSSGGSGRGKSGGSD